MSKKREPRQFILLNEDQLITAVEQRPILFDKAMKGYRKPTIREKAWQEVATICSSTVDECKKRWRSLRDAFMKQCRFQTSQNNAKRKKWTFFDQMSFLGDYLDLGESSKYIKSDYDDEVDQVDLADGIHNVTDQPESVIDQRESVLPKLDNKDLIKDDQRSIELDDTDGAIFLNFSEINSLKGDENICVDRIINKESLSANMLQDVLTKDSDNLIMDQNDKFLLSCSPVLKRLTNKKNALARLKIQQVLFEIEFGE